MSLQKAAIKFLIFQELAHLKELRQVVWQVNILQNRFPKNSYKAHRTWKLVRIILSSRLRNYCRRLMWWTCLFAVCLTLENVRRDSKSGSLVWEKGDIQLAYCLVYVCTKVQRGWEIFWFDIAKIRLNNTEYRCTPVPFDENTKKMDMISFRSFCEEIYAM